jgi:hypothetical protein
MSGDPLPDDEWADIVVSSRPFCGYWYWRDKPVGERGAAREVLGRAGLCFENLRSRPEGDDPPDCEAEIDGKLCGIEVTELVDESSLKRSLKRAKQHGVEAHEDHRAWTREDFLAALQALIDRKDRPSKVKGGTLRPLHPRDRHGRVLPGSRGGRGVLGWRNIPDRTDH